MNSCERYDMREAILASVRRGDSPSNPSAAEHLAGCSACRAEAERAARVLSVWRDSGPDPAAVARARVRFAARDEAPHGAFYDRVRWALVGAVAMAAVFGVVHVVGSRAEPIATVTKDTETSSGAPGTRSRGAPPLRGEVPTPFVDKGGSRQALEQGSRVELAAGERAEVVTAGAPPIALDGPCLVELRFDPREASGWRVVYLEGTPRDASPSPTSGPSPTVSPKGAPAPGAPVASSGAAAIDPQEAWTRAANAMKTNDFAAADRAFSELNMSSDVTTRENSKLSRAELWIANGRAAEVKPMLEDLAGQGSTEFVRKRASALLTKAASGPER